MSAPEPAVSVPAEKVEEAVASDECAAAVVAEVVTPAVDAEAATAGPIAPEDPAKSESKADEHKKDTSKGTSIFNRLLSSFKGDKKTKATKSPKKEKKKEEVEATGDAPKEASDPPAEVVETAKETEAVVTETAPAADVPAVEEVKETQEATVPPKADVKTLKVGRRLSARVGDFFKSKPKAEVHTPAKVDEYPPVITAVHPVGPLENPATEGPKAEEGAKVEASAPVVAATA